MNYLDMLATLGAGSAHPGGFAATMEQFEKFPISPGSKVLEIGCGTGRTACYLAKQGCDVTGIDIRPNMIDKACLRAHEERVEARFLVGDACALPFMDRQFDVVLAESVTIFVDSAKALSEYCRVLRTGGILYDREIIMMKECTEEVLREVREFYGVNKLYYAEDWISLMKKSGFGEASVGEKKLFSTDMWLDEFKHPDLYQKADPDSYTNPELWETANKYNEIMTNYLDYFGYSLLIGNKV
ncbi:class I SAM-dependent methyltransferase [Ferviditalea candida]|uniref:Methyltransferase domain-containing protein n=1 Tax=Ferviditalea candida TaxID=3108399 RepID=A0ABU5ZGT4_9BACL|nr:methyltransferase domain-containing protein [Paenibacillaceae bacterium T2]